MTNQEVRKFCKYDAKIGTEKFVKVMLRMVVLVESKIKDEIATGQITSEFSYHIVLHLTRTPTAQAIKQNRRTN